MQGELDFIKAVPQETVSTSYNRNRPEMNLPGPESITDSSQQMAAHNHRAYDLNSSMSPYTLCKMLSLHWLDFSLLKHKVYKGSVLWKILITASVRPFLTFF